MRSADFRVPDAEPTCAVGIGASLFDRLFAGPGPSIESSSLISGGGEDAGDDTAAP